LGDSPTGLTLSILMTQLEEERRIPEDTASNTAVMDENSASVHSVSSLISVKPLGCEDCGKVCRDKSSLRYVAKLHLSSGSTTDDVTHSENMLKTMAHPGIFVVNVKWASDIRTTEIAIKTLCIK
jgi:hypothetical protein